MVTEKARQLAKLANENLLENLHAHGDLMKELRENCTPTLEEFLKLAEKLVYRPIDYYEAVIRPMQKLHDIENIIFYRICQKCAIPHFENCGSCFGFGVYSVPDRPGEVFPVTASEAIETKSFRGEVKACPECGSTVLGLPTQHPHDDGNAVK